MATHLVLLQGIVPHHILPYSDYAIVGQAWSISLEWQFYLVAPLMLLCLKSPRGLYMVAALVSAMVALQYRGGYGFLPYHAWLFGVGIASYYLWKHRSTVAALEVIAVAAICFALICRSVPLLIWFAVFGALLIPQGACEPACQLAALAWSASTSRPHLLPDLPGIHPMTGSSGQD